MKRSTLALAVASLVIVGCHKSFTEQDMAGTYKLDPDVTAQAKDPNFDPNVTMTLSADKSASFDGKNGVSIQGDWSLNDNKLEVKTKKLVIVNSQLPNGRLEMSMKDALDKMSRMGMDQKNIVYFSKMAQPQDYDISSDGKELVQQGKPQWDKTS